MTTNYMTGIQQGVRKMPTMSARYSHPPIGVYLATIITITGLSSNKYVSSILFRLLWKICPYYLKILLNL